MGLSAALSADYEEKACFRTGNAEERLDLPVKPRGSAQNLPTLENARKVASHSEFI
jgi:hypothetical protein